MSDGINDGHSGDIKGGLKYRGIMPPMEMPGEKIVLYRPVVVDSGSSGSLKEEPKRVLGKDYLNARIPHLPVEALPVFGKVIGSASDVGALVGAGGGGKGVSGDSDKGSASEWTIGIDIGTGDDIGAEVVRQVQSDGITSAEGETTEGAEGIEAASSEAVVRKFPLPKCPRCRMAMQDSGSEFVCGKGSCRQRPITVEQVEEKWEREQGE